MSRIIHVVGNSVKVPPSALLSKHSNSYTIVFVGKMSYEPNIVAVTYFVNKIFPTLKKTYPNLKFVIVGATPAKQVLDLQKVPGVEITGFVDSIEPYLQKATIVVAPMLTGAGIQNKIIQAMSFGCCVATSPIGAEGLNIQANEIAILKDDGEWIEGLTHLLKNRDLRCEMGSRARGYIEKNLTMDKVSEDFWKFMESGF